MFQNQIFLKKLQFGQNATKIPKFIDPGPIPKIERKISK
jgi:hypothetical protein